MILDFFTQLAAAFLLSAPHYVLCSVPFFSDLRVKKRTVIAMILVTSVVMAVSRASIYTFIPDPRILEPLFLLGFYIIYFIQYKTYFAVCTAKLFYIFLVVQAYSSLLNVAGKFMQLLIFPESQYPVDSWIYIGITLLMMTATYPFLFRFFRNTFSEVFHQYPDRGFWKLCITPFLYFVIIMVYTTILPAKLLFSGWEMFVVFVLIALTGLTTYFLTLRTGVDMAENIRQKTEMEGQLALQAQRFLQLTENIEHARVARHDLRHHLSVIATYVNGGNMDGLRAYLNDYTDNLPEDAIAPLCHNYAVDAVVRHYLSRLSKIAVELNIRFQLPAKTGIPDSELCIVFGNILENAVESCLRQKEGRRFITARCETTARRVQLTVDNSGDDCGKNYKMERYKGLGVGLNSVRAVAEKYGGTLNFCRENGIYKTSVMLLIQPNEGK